MKSPLSSLLSLLLLLIVALACASSNRNSNSKSVDLTNTHPNYSAPSPRTAVEEAQHLKEENSKRLRANLSEYGSPPSSSRLTGRPYINGKAIALSKDQEDKEYSLDSRLINSGEAESPEEVGTVVLVKNHQQKIGTYVTDSGRRIPGFVIVADLVIVDRSLGAVIYRKTFRGDRPEIEVTISPGASEVTGSDPRDKISEFLEKLPRK